MSVGLAGEHLEGHPPAKASIATGVLLTAIAWLVSRIVVGAAWGPARDPFTFRTSLWRRYDSRNYLTIAIQGRTFGRCGTPGFPETALIRYAHLQWCGSAGWLPGYPILIRAVHVLGISRPSSGLLISWIGLAAALFLVWHGWGRDLRRRRALAMLVLFGLFPGAVYNFAIFPTSVALALEVGAILTATRGRFFSAAVLIAGAGLCYPSAWFGAVGLTLALAVVAVPLGGRVIARRTLWGLAGLVSLVGLGVHDQYAFNHFDAYFLELKSGTALSSGFPGYEFLRLIFRRDTVAQEQIGRFSGAVLALQSIVALVLSAGAVAVAAMAWRRGRLGPAQVYPAFVAIAIVVALMVVSSGGVWNRSVVLAAPCVVCFRRAPWPILSAMTAITGVIAALIARPFFLDLLV